MGEQWLRDIKKAIVDLPHQYVGVIPFSREIQPEPQGTDYIPYGSTLFTNLALDLGFEGLHFDLAKFDYLESVKHRYDMLNDEYIVPIKHAIEFFNIESPNKQYFIRPSKDLKQFSGQCIEAAEAFKWLKDALECDSTGTYKLTEDTNIVIASPKDIQAEWRHFIVNGKIVSSSMYRARKQLVKRRELDQTVLDEAQKLADVWLPDSCCVMDTALVDNEVKVIEFNCINSSGFYDHDIKEIFTKLYDFHVR